MKLCFKTILALAAAGIACSVPAAKADILAGSFNQIDYADGETIATYDAGTHTYTPVATTVVGGITVPTIAVGDHFYGISAATVQTALPGGAQSVTGTTAFDLVIAKIIDPLTGASIASPSTFTGAVEVLFTSDSTTGGFLTGSGTYTLDDGSSVTGLGATANTLDALYQHSTLTAATIGVGSQATGIANASNGSLYGNFGLGATLTPASANSSWGAAGVGYWVSDVTLNAGGVDPILSGSVPFSVGLVDLSPSTYGFKPLTNVELSLQTGGELTGTDGTNIHNNRTGGSTGFTLVGGGHAFSQIPTGAWSNTSADPLAIDPNAPEPASMLIMGMGLAFGLPFLRRRRKCAA